MELLKDNVVFSSSSKVTKWRCKVLLVNFNKALSISNVDGNITKETICEHDVDELLHAVAGVCSVSLPDMEIPAIYSTLTNTNCRTVVVVTSRENIISYRDKVGCPKPVPTSNGVTVPYFHKEEKMPEDENPFSNIISDDEDAETEEVLEGEEESADKFMGKRKAFLEAAALRRSLTDQLALGSVGSEHCVLACAAFSYLSNSTVGTVKAIQLSLLAVRKSCRKMGIGRHLMQKVKDPEVVGHYNALLTFADPKAEDFFTRHGFSEDPILSARYQPIVEYWENSTLMVYLPPFSESGLAVGSLNSLAHFQDYYKQWRESVITSYSTQLGVMERLRHELLLLHSKVQAQDELIEVLGKELKQSKQSYLLLEQEFQQYRKQSQHLLCDATVQGAEEWIKTNK